MNRPYILTDQEFNVITKTLTKRRKFLQNIHDFDATEEQKVEISKAVENLSSILSGLLQQRATHLGNQKAVD